MLYGVVSSKSYFINVVFFAIRRFGMNKVVLSILCFYSFCKRFESIDSVQKQKAKAEQRRGNDESDINGDIIIGGTKVKLGIWKCIHDSKTNPYKSNPDEGKGMGKGYIKEAKL